MQQTTNIASDSKRSRWIRLAVIWLVLMLLCVGTAAPDLYKNSRKTVTVTYEDVKVLSINDHVVTQNLILDGKLESLTLYCSAPSGALYNAAKIIIKITQGDIIITQTVAAKSLSSSITLEKGLGKFKTGIAVLTIQGSGFPQGTDLFFYASQTKTSGLSAASMDNNITLGPLLLAYTIMQYNTYYYYDTILLLLLIAIITLIAWLLAFHREKIANTRGLFICSFMLLFTYISLANPMATFLAEPNSEAAYEFWYKARHLSFFGNLMSLMSGESLVWVERIMMWIAVKLAGNGPYVFMIAHLLEATMICSFASMLCLPTFKRYFPAEVRLLASLYLGGIMLFPSAYYFWSVSYWVPLFVVAFAFVDMNRLKRWQYIMAMIFTTILCITRLYHILFVPMSLWTIILLGKTRGKRFSLYCGIAALMSIFNVLYSLMVSPVHHLDLSLIKPLQFLENTIYYQVQVLNSMFFGNGSLNPVLVNTLSLLLIIGIAGFVVYLLLRHYKSIKARITACILGAMGMFSFGSVLINVVVSGCSSTVVFPHDYGAQVSWRETFYQNADLHFSYSYFAVFVILLVLLYLLYERIIAFSTHFYGTEAMQRGFHSLAKAFVLFASVLGIMLFTANNIDAAFYPQITPVDWKSVYQVTQNHSYYMPINVYYWFANISLQHNSRAIICGYSDTGELNLWSPAETTYAEYYSFTEASPGSISDLSTSEMISLSACRANVNFANPIYMVIKDVDGNHLLRMKQTNSPDRYWTDFMLETPLIGVYSVAFEYEDGSPAYMRDGMHIGVATP